MIQFKKNKYVFSKSPSNVKNDDDSLKIRSSQISLLVKEIFLYKVLLKDLVSHIPNEDQKNLLLNIAYYVVEEQEIFSKFERKRILPIRLISSKTHIDSSFIETWQEYIITYIIILANPNYKNIQDYLKVEYNEDKLKHANQYNGLTLIEKPRTVGIVLKISKKSNIILTSDGRFIKINRKEQEEKIGEEVYGIPKKVPKNVGLKISIAFMFVLFVVFAIYKQYTTPVTTVIVSSSIQVKYEVNKFDKVVYVYSNDDLGKELIRNTDPMDSAIDEALKTCIEYYNDSKLISASGILITVNGKALEYGKLQETANYVADKKLNVLMNNAGNQHKLLDNVLRQREENDTATSTK